MKRGEHSTKSGILAIINHKASMNLSIPAKLKVDFPNYVAVPRPIVQNQIIRRSPLWLAGFVSGEGCFSVGIIKYPKWKDFKYNYYF